MCTFFFLPLWGKYRSKINKVSTRGRVRFQAGWLQGRRRDGGRGPRLCLGIRFRRTQPRIYIAGECPGLCPGVHFRRTRPWTKATGECRRLPRFMPPPLIIYLTTFSVGRKFSIAQISLEIFPHVKTIRRPSG